MDNISFKTSTQSEEKELMNCNLEHGHLDLPDWVRKHGHKDLIKNQNVDQNYSDCNNPNINIDPDNCFYGNKSINCNYYTEHDYDTRINTDNKLKIIHFNSRSLYTNFDQIKEYLMDFKNPFDIIAITETWINEEKGMDFELEGYNLVCMNREKKGGGGVALFIADNIKFKVLKDISVAVDNMLECITVEIDLKKNCNIIIYCIYRAQLMESINGKMTFDGYKNDI